MILSRAPIEPSSNWHSPLIRSCVPCVAVITWPSHQPRSSLERRRLPPVNIVPWLNIRNGGILGPLSLSHIAPSLDSSSRIRSDSIFWPITNYITEDKRGGKTTFDICSSGGLVNWPLEEKLLFRSYWMMDAHLSPGEIDDDLVLLGGKSWYTKANLKKYKNLPQIKQNKSNNGVARTALFEPSPHPFQREQQQQSTPPLQLLEDELSLPFYLTTSLLIWTQNICWNHFISLLPISLSLLFPSSVSSPVIWLLLGLCCNTQLSAPLHQRLPVHTWHFWADSGNWTLGPMQLHSQHTWQNCSRATKWYIQTWNSIKWRLDESFWFLCL